MQRKKKRNRHRDRQDFADQQAVGIDRRCKADALRHPGTYQRRERGLHHGDAEGRHDGSGIEHRDEAGPMPRSAEPTAQNRRPAHQRRHRAEPRDQQRARDRGACEQRHRQAGEDADLRLAQMQVVVDQRDDRRHREDGHAQRDPASHSSSSAGNSLTVDESRVCAAHLHQTARRLGTLTTVTTAAA